MLDVEFPDGKRHYIGRVEKPDKGFTAYFVQLVYDSGYDAPFKFTTDVSIIPDILDFSLDDYGKGRE